MAGAVTFVMPTKDRADLACRAIASCLEASNFDLRVDVVVIDGGSDPAAARTIQTRFEKDRRVKLVCQPDNVNSFMEACYYGVGLIRSPYATFMYDDDVLSPYIGLLYRSIIDQGADIGLGFGDEVLVSKTYPFSVPLSSSAFDPIVVMAGWFGGSPAKWSYMPYSPICCLVRTDLLIDWVADVESFGQRTCLRKELMLKRNVGPDLMIFFRALLETKHAAIVTKEIVAQFSVTSNSFSSSVTKADLQIGYWLARIYAIEKMRDREPRLRAAKFVGYCAILGAQLLVWMVSRARWQRAREIIGEMSAFLSATGPWRSLLGVVLALGEMLWSRTAHPRQYRTLPSLREANHG